MFHRHGSLRASAFLILIGLAAALWPASAGAEDRIWSAIVLASKKEDPKPAPAPLQNLQPKIKGFFGYNQLELIGSTEKAMEELSEKWLVPSPHFWMSVKSRKPPGEKLYQLQISLVHDKRPILKTEAKVGPGMPLLIRGPMHANGQVIIVLQVK